MTMKHALRDFAVTGTVALGVSALVTYLYAAVAHGAGIIDWEASIRLALTLGIVMPLVHRRAGVHGLRV
jgi:hypothetical protein